MRQLELLAPARDTNIGIAAIDCGADAVYIAGPQFGARQAAGNDIEDIRKLCEYAHRYGVRIFVTLNTILYDSELENAYRQMLAVQEAGADAVIVQDMAIAKMAACGIGDFKEEFRLPLHASTQCAIRTPQQAVFLENLGFSRLILERELSLEQIRAIRQAVSCELEFFVHGALCVCYSGQCYLSEKIAGRSANRGACIQACRSLYDLVDANGKVLVRNKALLSLKDYNLRNRIEELAEAGITSFKIEGRLKNESYVRNVVRDYSMALDEIVSRRSDEYVRGSFGKVSGGFYPDTTKTFNRGYTELFIDGRRGQWSSMDAAKSMGEEIGTITSTGGDGIYVRFANRDIILNNGDGFSFVAKDGSVCGFRGDVCKGNHIQCKRVPSIFIGAKLFRNINTAFEKEIEKNRCVREIEASISVKFDKTGCNWVCVATCRTEDGREVVKTFDAGDQEAANLERMYGVLNSQLCKTVGIFKFSLNDIGSYNVLPFMSVAAVNHIRRTLAEELESMPCIKRDLLLRKIEKIAPVWDTAQKEISYKFNVSNRLSHSLYTEAGAGKIEDAYELSHSSGAELMRTKYCIRYELGMCPVHHKAPQTGPLFLLNNGQRFALQFDCRNCEMTVTEANTPQQQK
jgi:putative protease